MEINELTWAVGAGGGVKINEKFFYVSGIQDIISRIFI